MIETSMHETMPMSAHKHAIGSNHKSRKPGSAKFWKNRREELRGKIERAQASAAIHRPATEVPWVQAISRPSSVSASSMALQHAVSALNQKRRAELERKTILKTVMKAQEDIVEQQTCTFHEGRRDGYQAVKRMETIKATTENMNDLSKLMEVANVAGKEKSAMWKEVNELREEMRRRWEEMGKAMEEIQDFWKGMEWT